MARAVWETKFSDGKCWLGWRNESWVMYRWYMSGTVWRFNSLMVNAGSGGLGGYYEVASVGWIGWKQVFLLMEYHSVTVSILDSRMVTDRFTDYKYCGSVLENVCLYDYSSIVYRRPLSDALAKRGNSESLI